MTEATMTVIGGGCMCGAVRFEVAAPLFGMAACHCRDCQYAAGGGPAYVALAPKAAFTVTKGKAKVYRSTADNGAVVGRAFCPECGTPLWSEPAVDLPYVPLKAGALDEPPAMAPMAHIWTRSAPPWHAFTPGAPQFETASPGP